VHAPHVQRNSFMAGGDEDAGAILNWVSNHLQRLKHWDNYYGKLRKGQKGCVFRPGINRVCDI
jgi:hypothetical protein